ncbi:D-alanine--D-alanine ligase family protein [Pandoraea sp. ISTKB]|uniref:D-alanine--D-alanine ligase family protein n=1 Tax=Pandoraea sp. ISTKB TaxID=1586708 RepID=UPI00084748F5|nr:D-alanine--D-alanine ligase family protein [Pandoraea sp. ISTKB]ODP34753.1 hypothetical protein A9762_14045 [Pandoraea sp. ISTKB]
MSNRSPVNTRVAVIFGGANDEYTVSCKSAANVIAALDPARYRVTPVRIDPTGQWIVGAPIETNGRIDFTSLLTATRNALLGDSTTRASSLAMALPALGAQDVVFPVLHGPYGEDGTVQGLLELLGVPYVGSGVFASAAGMDKVQTKRLLASQGHRVADGIVVEGPDDVARQLTDDVRDRLGLPVFVKPARSGSSVGVTRVTDWAEVHDALAVAFRSDAKVLIEQAVHGREIDVAVLEHADGRLEAGPPLEIVLHGRQSFFTFDAKYESGESEFRIPAALSPEDTQRLQDAAIDAFRTLGCRGMLRVDFFLRPRADGTLEPVINEVNTIPGLTALSQFPQMWQRKGLAYDALLSHMIDTAAAKAHRA